MSSFPGSTPVPEQPATTAYQKAQRFELWTLSMVTVELTRETVRTLALALAGTPGGFDTLTSVKGIDRDAVRLVMDAAALLQQIGNPEQADDGQP